MKCVIMAGGKGTRISSIASDIPKPMIQIGDKPVLEHEIISLREQGIDDFIITVSHLGNIIIDYFGDGSQWDVNIRYYYEKEPLGNAGALFELRDYLTEDFLLLNADAVFDVDFNRMIQYHEEHRALATLFTHPNNHPYDSGLLIANDKNEVTQWLTKEDVRPEFYKNRVNAGIHILSPKLIKRRPDTPKVDLDRQILKPLAGTGKLIVYDSPEYVRDMGTPERYRKVCDDYDNGMIAARNLLHKQKAIFLDRDGTINKYVGFLRDVDDFVLLSGVTEAIKSINESGFLTIVVTNQPVIARGEVTLDELNWIHNKMETLLGREGAYVDDIYFCPHHPHSGYEGEIKELKIACECRKPKPGMILSAARKFNIDLSESWVIGDGENDIKAGKNAGCKTALIGNGDFGQDKTGESLLELVRGIL